MLRMIRSVRELDFYGMAGIYADSIENDACENYPGQDDGRLQAEMDLYAYLRDVFFRIPGAVCCVWEENGVSVSALRLEPYRDGLLLTALETRPDARRKGYARNLIRQVLQQVDVPVYSHISRRNAASIAVHEKCGFEKITNFAVYLDGSVSRSADTYCRNFVNY